jgi:hypothetical protein
MAAMDWSALATTILGGLLVLVGGFIGQWWAERRAIAREQRDRQHEHEVWARALRYEAHVAFLTEFDARYRDLDRAHSQGRYQRPSSDFLVPVWSRHQSVRLVCTADTAQLAFDAVIALTGYAFYGRESDEVTYKLDLYLGAVREEFHLPPIPLQRD